MIVLERPGAGAPVGVSPDLGGAAEELREHFQQHHWLLVRGLFGPRLLDEVREELTRSKFERRADAMGGELMLRESSPIVRRMLFILNDASLHRAVAAATGIAHLARFDGRIYRRAADLEHFHVWHDDVAGDARRVAMSLNLSSEHYEGGLLQMRHKGATDMLVRVHNTGPGDALFFRVRADLEHCMTDVTAGTKTALAGWFGSAPPWPSRLSSAQ